MSADVETDEMMRCASCGITDEGDGVELKKCTACKLVRYCGVECQRKHRPEHKRACKKRAAELRDPEAVVVGCGPQSNNNDGGVLDTDNLARMVETGEISEDRILFAQNIEMNISPERTYNLYWPKQSSSPTVEWYYSRHIFDSAASPK